MIDKNNSRLHAKELYDCLGENNIHTYFGVPDSILSPFCAYLQRESSSNTITANEGNAVGAAIGYHLATGEVALVYMQNSGLSNAFDPLTSLADQHVLSVPMLLLISWRGEPGKTDEPQHTTPGAITLEMLDSAKIPHVILLSDTVKARQQIAAAILNTRENNRPYGLILQADVLETHSTQTTDKSSYPMTREQAIKQIVDNLNSDDIVVTGIGKTSRELSEYRDKSTETHSHDVLVTGGMGHASSIAHSIAMQKKDKTIFCLDGDGAAIMHLGALTTIGTSKSNNFVHIVLNNGKHDSVGGQSTVGFAIDFCAIAEACGYQSATMITAHDQIAKAIIEARESNGPAMIEVRIRSGARKELTRPSQTPLEYKTLFMKNNTPSAT